jgi:uncharacterized protein
MIIGTAQITIHAPWANSLKDKRMTVKSLCAKVHARFNVAIAEVEDQDIQRRIALGIACVANETGVADSMIGHVLNFIENNTEGEIIDIRCELR